MSSPPGEPHPPTELLRALTSSWEAAIEFVEESDEALAELLHCLREQSLCVDYHRYGTLGARSGETGEI